MTSNLKEEGVRSIMRQSVMQFVGIYLTYWEGPLLIKNGFNLCYPRFSTQGLSIVSWNARSLLHHNPALRSAKLAELSSLLARFDVVVVILEAHGTRDLHKFLLKVQCRTHELFSSCCCNDDGSDKGDSGGVLIFSRIGMGSVACSLVLVPGRILEVAITFEETRVLHVCGAHNYGLSLPLLRHFS